MVTEGVIKNMKRRLRELEERVAMLELGQPIKPQIETQHDKGMRYIDKINRVYSRKNRLPMNDSQRNFLNGVRDHIRTYDFISDRQAEIVDRIIGELL